MGPNDEARAGDRKTPQRSPSNRHAACGSVQAVRWVLALLLAALVAQAVLSMQQLSASTDELTHLPSGYSYLATGEVRLNPQHPPLMKLLSAAPLLALEPDFDHAALASEARLPNEWAFGFRFLYRNDVDQLLFWGRLPVVATAVLLAAYVFVWARRLFGDAAGAAALFLCAFSPTLIAHARLVTFDVPLACFSTMALYHLWRHEQSGRGLHLALSGVGLGLAMATKYSGLLLLPTFALLLAPRALGWPRGNGPAPAGGPARGAHALTTFFVAFAIGLAVVQASYLFSSDPLIYWKGALRVNVDHNPNYAYYLLGRFDPDGFWYYFPAAFLFKTPLPALIAIGAALVSVRRFPTPRRRDELFLAVPVAVFGVGTALLADEMGVRYLLPIYPLLFVFASRLGPAAVASRRARIAAAILAVWYAAGTLRVFPDHLAYFNELAGGPENGHEILDDSNIDWGTDIKRLAAWLEREGVEEIRLRYAGHPFSSAAHYGIRAEPLEERDWKTPPRPGVYVLGTHVLIRGRLQAAQQGVATDWLDRYEPRARVGYSLWVYEFPQPATPMGTLTGP